MPGWILYALAAAFASAAIPLVQERFRAPPFALAVGLKIVVAALTLPFMLQAGLPSEPAFYLLTAAMSGLWCINDVQYFNAVREVGAGPVSRLAQGMLIVGFLLWFLVDPALLLQYADMPWRSAGIVACILLAALFAMQLHRCTVTRRAVRLIWFSLIMVAVGPILNKLIVNSAPMQQTAYAFTCLEAIMMVTVWLAYAAMRRWTPFAPLRDPAVCRTAVRASLFGGVAMAISGVLVSLALGNAEHPSYAIVLVHTNVLLIIGAHRLLGIRDDSNVRAGLGIAACAAALALLKSL